MIIIGIDLGTTNSCVYYLDADGNPVLVLSKKRYKFFPSVVWTSGPGKEIVVGHDAKIRLGENPPPVATIKRKMGTTETVNLGGRQQGAVEVSAHILRFAKKLVEEAAGGEIGGVIVTVPAYFSSAAKRDTERAAVEAFFGGEESRAAGRVELLLEPEAAAYAYATEDAAESLRLLVYDLGGGTFDVTILEKSLETGLTVVKFGGDPHLGGDNVDDRIASWLLYLIRGGNAAALDRILAPGRYPADQRYTVLQLLLRNDRARLKESLLPDDRDLLIPDCPTYVLDLDSRRPDDFRRIQTLKALAENAKKDLSASTEAVITKQGAFQDQNGELVDVDVVLSRDEFDRLIGDLIERTLECTEETLRAAGCGPDAIDRVLLVGGSSRMGAVKDRLSAMFSCPLQLADPDLIVARGAALRARNLHPPPLDALAATRLTLEFPFETADARIDIPGKLAEPLQGHAYLLRDGRDVSDASVSGQRFTFKAVPLTEDSENRFLVEVVDSRENSYASAEIAIRHNRRSLPIGDRLAPKVTKPIRALSTDGMKVLFPEGTILPATEPFTCYRATNDDHIAVEFYEADRHLSTLTISGVDASLPIGAPVDLCISVTAGYAVSATATIRETGQKQTVEFEISPLDVPPLAKMDTDFDEFLAQIENDVELVRDINARTAFFQRASRLAAGYQKARRELDPDPHKLYATLGEMQTLLIEIRGAQAIMEPPFEEVRGLVGACRSLAGRLPDGGQVPKQHILERLDHLWRAAEAAWKREDAPEWKQLFLELRKLHDQLEQAARGGGGGGGRQELPPPFEIQRAMVAWIEEIRQKAAKNGLLERFAEELDAVLRHTRGVDTRDLEGGRRQLLDIVETQLRPLEARIDRAIEEKGGRPTPSGAKVRF